MKKKTRLLEAAASRQISDCKLDYYRDTLTHYVLSSLFIVTLSVPTKRETFLKVSIREALQ